MKKFFIFSLAAAATCLTATAQVQVDSLSRLVVGPRAHEVIPVIPGSIKTTGVDTNDKSNTGYVIPVDPDAKICVLGGWKNQNGSGGRISFGDGANVFIQEAKGTISDQNRLDLYGAGGVAIIGTDNSIAARYQTKTNKFTFNCDMTVDGVFVNSDSRLKSDIEELSDTQKALSAINAVSYSLTRGTARTAAPSADAQEQETEMPADARTRFGFVAQQVREVFPQLVVEDEDGYLAVDYIGFIPVLVDAVNTLSAKVEEQQAVIESLAPANRKKASEDPYGIGAPALSQNRPNPFSESTVIECNLPQSVADAALYIYDMQGKQLMRIPVTGRGATSVTVEARRLGAGMYIYSLIADGSEIDSRRMIVNEK